MPLKIIGIKINEIRVGEDDNGRERVGATYQLLADTGRAIGSKESLSSIKDYNNTPFVPAADTVAALKAAVALYKRDVEQSIGLTAE